MHKVDTMQESSSIEESAVKFARGLLAYADDPEWELESHNTYFNAWLEGSSLQMYYKRARDGARAFVQLNLNKDN